MNTIQTRLQKELTDIKDAGLYKQEHIIQSQQSTEISVNNKTVLNFCANNYLGLANHPQLIQAAKDGVDKWGFGLSSVRFICGTQSIHKQNFYKRMTPSYTPPALMPMVDFLKHCLVLKMPLFQMR